VNTKLISSSYSLQQNFTQLTEDLWCFCIGRMWHNNTLLLHWTMQWEWWPESSCKLELNYRWLYGYSSAI